MDFIERLADKVNEITDRSVTCRIGYLGSEESFVVYPLPGSRTVMEYMDGDKDQQLNFEFAMKSKAHSRIHSILWAVQSELENMAFLESEDGSFLFDEITITNKPFINASDDQGWFIFLLDVQAKITVINKEAIT